jgi:hypothetical protein
MMTHDDVRSIALALPGVVAGDEECSFAVATTNGKVKTIVWLWRERLDPKRPKVPNPGVIVLRVPDEGEKHALIASSADAIFTEPHYDGYAAVLVRLDAVSRSQMRGLLAQAHAVTREKKKSKRATAKLATSVKKRATSKLRAGVSGHRELNSREAHSRSKS